MVENKWGIRRQSTYVHLIHTVFTFNIDLDLLKLKD